MKKLLSMIAAYCVLVTAVFVSSGCDNSGSSNFDEQYVLDGWMPIGHRISIRLTKSADIESFYDAAALGVSGATVTIWEFLNGDTTTYLLAELDGGRAGTYYAPNLTDSVKVGYDYALRIEHEGHVITARTKQAPPAIHVDSVKIGERRVENFADTLEYETVVYGEYYELFYHTESRCAGVNMIIECIEPDWFSNDDLAVSGNNGPGTTNVWFWNLREGNSVKVPPLIENFQGRHRVRAMACDTAGYDYFFTLYPGDPRSNPQTNVQGALGLFSVYDADTAYFCLTDPEADVVYSCQP